MRSVFLALILLSASLTALAQVSIPNYEQERERILSLAVIDRLDALTASSVFDVSTPIGKYFYNSLYINTHLAENYYTLTSAERELLQRDYPEYFYEGEVLRSFVEDESAAFYDNIDAIIQRAESKHWPRIKRWATSMKVERLLDDGFNYSAIIAIKNIVDTAPDMTHVATLYDYALVVMYHDLAAAYYQLGDFPMSMAYCEKYGNYMQDDMFTQLDSQFCIARAKVKLHDLQSALDITYPILQASRKAGIYYIAIGAYALLSTANRELGHINQAEVLAKDGLAYITQQGLEADSNRFHLYYALAQIAIQRKDEAAVERYLSNMQAELTDLPPRAKNLQRFQRAKAEHALLQHQYKEAAHIYKTLFDNTLTLSSYQYRPEDFDDISAMLDNQQMRFLKQRASLEHAKSQYMTTLAIITSVLCALVLLLLWRILHQKKQLEQFSQLDQLTGIHNRWHAERLLAQSIKQADKTHSPLCIALLDIDHFRLINDEYGHEVGDAALKYFTKTIKYQLEDDDIFARHGGEEFLLVLKNTSLRHGESRIDAMRNVLVRQNIPGLSSAALLRFSCGLLEVRSKMPVSAIVSQCDALLYEAKRNGRNQTKSSECKDAG